MPTKPSKFATEAANKIVERRSNLSERARAVNALLSAKLIDQSFSEARTAFEELVKAIIFERNQRDDASICSAAILTNKSLAAAQNILKEWKGE